MGGGVRRTARGGGVRRRSLFCNNVSRTPSYHGFPDYLPYFADSDDRRCATTNIVIEPAAPHFPRRAFFASSTRHFFSPSPPQSFDDIFKDYWSGACCTSCFVDYNSCDNLSGGIFISTIDLFLLFFNYNILIITIFLQ